MNRISKLAPLFLLPLVSCGNREEKIEIQNSPNIVFFLIDDMGWKDLGCYGSEFYETPNIDQLAKEGTRFTNAYTSVSICAPARATALTGYHPAKLGMWNHKHHLPNDPKTFVDVLKENGYNTWHVGKWHCGSPENNTMPEGVGFDINIGGGQSWAPGSYFWPYEGKKITIRNFVPGVKEISSKGDYLTDVLTDNAVELIKDRNKDEAFFLNMWHYAVHNPLQAKEDLIEKYRQKIKDMGLREDEGRFDPATGSILVTSHASELVPVYAAMIESVDQSVGRIVNMLKEEGIYENTLFVFYSDNGPTTDKVPCVPLNGGKNSTYEAGVRVPAFFTWKDHIPEASVSNEQINIADIPFTIIDLALNKDFVGGDDPIDGISISPVFKGEEIGTREFIWYFPDTRLRWAQRANAAILGKDGLKYIMFFNGDKDELYDINSDISESVNIIDENPKRALELKENLIDFLHEYYYRMPPPPNEYIEIVKERLRIN